MKIDTAEQILKWKAKGKPFSVTYDRFTFLRGKKEVKCSVYIEGKGMQEAPTFNQALMQLAFEMNGNGGTE